MSKTTFAKAIIDKLAASIGTDGGSFNSNSASVAMQAVSDAITEYLIKNTVVEVAYSGTIPSTPPSPDPITKDSFKIVGKCNPTGVCDSFDSWIAKIEANIISGFNLAPKGQSGVVFKMKPFLNKGITLTVSDIKSIYDISDISPQQKVWELICDKIIKWINTSAKNTTSGSANRPTTSSTGTANILKITIN